MNRGISFVMSSFLLCALAEDASAFQRATPPAGYRYQVVVSVVFMPQPAIQLTTITGEDGVQRLVPKFVWPALVPVRKELITLVPIPQKN
jgi:hypothetical protein